MNIKKNLILVAPIIGLAMTLATPVFGEEGGGGGTICDALTKPPALSVDNGKKQCDDTYTNSCTPTIPDPVWTPLCCWDTSTNGCKQWSWRYACCGPTNSPSWGYIYEFESHDATYTCGWYAPNPKACEN
ncbi:MAG: hypothetical protein ACKVQS_12060 [Fimbriimonadaceae bacterium]